MSFSYDHTARLFGHGAAASFVVVFVLWVMGKLLGEYFTFVEISFHMKELYAPVFWGGVGGLLYLLNLPVSPRVRGYFYAIFPAFMYMASQFTWMQSFLFSQGTLTGFTNPESYSTFLIYILVWGSVTGKNIQ